MINPMGLTSTSCISWLKIIFHHKLNPMKFRRINCKILSTFRPHNCFFRKISRPRIQDSQTSSKITTLKRMVSYLKRPKGWDITDQHPAVAAVKIKIANNRTSKFKTCQFLNNSVNKWRLETSWASKTTWRTCWPLCKALRTKSLR
jgi:hypothetical protein